MIDKLLELHGIRYVISVDDCYSNITEMEIKAALLSEMNNSFLNFREEISKMGKKELLNNIEQMIEFSGEKEALIRDFLENFSKEQLLELYGLIPQEQSNKYTTEKERLIGFLDKLKQENLVDGYEVCMSTTEALKIDYEAKGQKFDSILWLIDRSFERVGESSEAGLQLARTIVGRSDGPTNYVYILSALAKDEGKTEEEIEAEFDMLLHGSSEDEKTSSFIYYLYKQRIMPDKIEKIEKGLAQGFKRKACYELFDLYLKSLEKSIMDSSKSVREIRQNTLDYLLDEMVRENSESYLEFLTRLINIFQLDAYQSVLAESNSELLHKIYYYKQLCEISKCNVGNKKEETQKVKKIREIELYNKYVNKQHLEVTTGDIFRIGNEFYFLASQPCDICLRGDGTRTLKMANLLLICDDSSKPVCSYKLSCFHDYTTPIVKYQSQRSFPFEILDLCVRNEDGKATISMETLMNDGEDEQKYLTTRYKLRMQSVISELHEIVDCCNVLDDFFLNHREINNEKLRFAYEKNKKIESQLLDYQVESGVLEYDVQRICRLNELVSIDIVNMFGINLSRIGHAFDFSERTIRNQQ